VPVYEYRCNKGHTFEALQSMSDEPLTTCTECRSQVQRVFHPVAVHFKGSGFYTTDYGRKRSSDGDSSSSKEKDKDSSSGKDSSKDAKASTPSD
jgi:putative FmdB family regulatory protein